MPPLLIAIFSLSFSQALPSLCESDINPSDPGPIIDDLYTNITDSTVFIKANCPCFCTLDENNFFVFKTNLDGNITNAWHFEGFANLSMQKPLEIIAINKRPPDDNGNPNYNSLKTVYSIAGTRISSKANEAPPLSNLEIENWAATIKSHSRGQKLERAHQFSLELFKKKRTKAAIDILLAVKPELETQHKIEILNDLGYFLEEADRYGEAIPVLEKVLAFENTRTPAYLNLGDAYQKSGEGSKAKANYQKYVELMEKGGKGAKVPARVRDILKH